MFSSLSSLFSSDGFMPHIHCYLDRPEIVWTMAITDALIGISYVIISVILYYLVKRIKLPFSAVFLAFGLFIFACGATHFIEIYTLWVPAYWFAALVKIVTAGASVATAVALLPLKEKIIAFAEAGKLSEERGLELETAYRVLESRVRDATQNLEATVSTRTAELLESRSFLDSLIENLPNMVFVKDAKNLNFVRFNKAGEKLLGVPRDELIGKSDYDFFPHEQADFFVSKDRAVLGGETIVDIPAEQIMTRDKGARILHTRKIPLLDKDGVPLYLLGISEDITEKIKADEERVRINREQAALEERERASVRTAFLAEASTALASSLDFRVTLKHLAKIAVPTLADWCTITIFDEENQFERVAAIHRDPSKQTLLEELNSVAKPDQTLYESSGFILRNGKSYLQEKITDDDLKRAAKDDRHLEIMRELGSESCMLVPIPGRDRILGTISFISGTSHRVFQKEDLLITEELGKRTGIAIDNAILYESAQKAIRVRDEFLSIASHELKTPITSLKLQLQVTRKSMKTGNSVLPTPEKLGHVLDVSINQVNRLTKLVEDLLDVSKIQAGKLSLAYEAVTLEPLIQDVRERFAEQSEETKTPIEIEMQTPVTGTWDRSRIEQVLDNLVSNAIKYAPGHPIKISARADGKVATIAVSDSGPGIAADKQTKIFERFERVTASRSISGLGLGLFIVSQIIRAQGGSIHVESKLGQGSTFVVTLPLEPQAEEKHGK